MAKNMPEEDRAAGTACDCIAPENLSAWIDGEYELTPAERGHLEHCEHCSALRQSYLAMSDALRTALEVECPDDLGERLVLGVREKLEKEKEGSSAPDGHHYWAWTARIAAMLVLLGLIGHFAFRDGGIAGKRKPAPPEVVTVAPQPGETQLQPASGVFLRGGVDIGKTRFAAAGDTPVTFSDASLAQVEKLARIEPKVRQVWIYEKGSSPAEIERTLRAQCGKLGIPLSALFNEEIDNASLIRRRSEHERIHNPNEKSAVYFNLTPGPLKSNVELLMMVLGPGRETNRDFSQHFEEEIACLLEGEAVIVFEEEEFLLRAGDTVRILPSRKHKLRNDGPRPVRVLFIKSKANLQ